jgi:hypothetical protein
VVAVSGHSVIASNLDSINPLLKLFFFWNVVLAWRKSLILASERLRYSNETWYTVLTRASLNWRMITYLFTSLKTGRRL